VAATGNTYTTNFALTENPIVEDGGWVRGFSEGVSWTDPMTGPSSNSTGQIAFGSQLPNPGAPIFTDSIAHRKGFAANHYAEGTIFNAVTDQIEVELLLRFAITSGNARGYEVDVVSSGQNSASINLVRWNGPLGSFTVLNGGNPVVTTLDVSTGVVLRATVIGNVITVTRNGVNVFTYDLQANFVSDGSLIWSDGNPGMGFWDGSLSNGAHRNQFGFSRFSAGDIP
jgi:hypothetical protein